MTLPKKIEPQNRSLKTPPDINGKGDITKGELPEGNSTITARLEELESMPHRNVVLHWASFILSMVSLIILIAWVSGSRGSVPGAWVLIDIGIGVIFAVEFFTRSGFRQAKVKYLGSHFFDFFAIVPALALVHNGFVIEGLLLWLILAARAIRVVDRLLGDGFVRRNILALVAGFEEELTDRVLERIIARIQADMYRACFSRGVADALVRNKPALLQRVRAATPHEGFVPGFAHIVGLDKALERAEEQTYDAIVGMLNSDEVDHAIRDVIGSMFSRMRNELGTRSWRQHLGIRSRNVNEKTADTQTLN
jgi:hypothetical protein